MKWLELHIDTNHNGIDTVVATLYIPSWYEWMQTVEERLFSHKGKKEKGTEVEGE